MEAHPLTYLAMRQTCNTFGGEKGSSPVRRAYGTLLIGNPNSLPRSVGARSF